MIDTITVKQTGILESPGILPEGWSDNISVRNDKRNFHIWNEDSHLQMFGIGTDYIGGFRVSLPKLLYGHNGRLVTTDTQVRLAFSQIIDDTSKFVNWVEPSPCYFTRVDLVWQFSGRITDFINAHRQIRHPMIRNKSIEYQGSSLTFPGKNCRISMYDKNLESHKIPGGIVRVEVQLQGPVLKRLIGDGCQPNMSNISIEKCYAVYRKILTRFHPRRVFKPSNLAEFLSIGIKDNWQADGQPCFDIWASQKSPRQVSRMRSALKSVLPKVTQIDWHNLLPKNQLPEIVEVSRHKPVT